MSIEVRMSGGYRVASFDDYANAERVVDALSDEGFPVEHLRVVAHDLRWVEQVTGRRTFATAAAGAALTGAVVGAAFGFVFGLFSWVEPLLSALALAVYGALLGALLGAAFGVITHWMSAGRRDFSSVRSVVADHYDVVADGEELAEQAGLTLLRQENAVR